MQDTCTTNIEISNTTRGAMHYTPPCMRLHSMLPGCEGASLYEKTLMSNAITLLVRPIPNREQHIDCNCQRSIVHINKTMKRYASNRNNDPLLYA